MGHDDILRKINEIMKDVFDDESIIVDDSTSAEDIAGWDSLMNTTLLLEIEDEYGIRIPMSEKSSLKNVGEIISAVIKQLQ